MSTEHLDRQHYFGQGKQLAGAAALVCFLTAMALSVEMQQDEHPSLALRIVTPFGVACAIALGMYARRPTNPSEGHQVA